jgi:hypothetical protein
MKRRANAAYFFRQHPLFAGEHRPGALMIFLRI